MSVFFASNDVRQEHGLRTMCERGVRCRICGAETEDLLDETVDVDDLVNVWCHRCDTVTEQVVVW